MASGPTRNHFINALVFAYNEHVPFNLYPHHIALLINLNVAAYVNANAEQLVVLLFLYCSFLSSNCMWVSDRKWYHTKAKSNSP